MLIEFLRFLKKKFLSEIVSNDVKFWYGAYYDKRSGIDYEREFYKEKVDLK